MTYKKKILLFAIAMLVSISSFAQKKGDMYVSGHFTADLGTYASVPSTGGSSSEWYAFDSSLDLGAEYGYFVADNVRLSLGVCFPFMTAPVEEIDGETSKFNAISLDIYPNVAYYVKMGERSYYTPALGVLYQRDRMKTSGSESLASISHASLWGVYIDVLSFEFKVSEKFSIGVNAGDIGACTSKHIYSKEESYKMNQLYFDLANGSVDFKFYF